MMVEETIAKESCTLGVQEEKASRKFLERKQRKQKLGIVRLQPLHLESSNEESGNESEADFMRASQTPLPEIPHTPGSVPPVTPLPEIPATPEAEIPTTPRGDVAVLASSSRVMSGGLARSLWHLLQSIKEGHMETWKNTEGKEVREERSGELSSTLVSLLIVAIVALFISYYLSTR